MSSAAFKRSIQEQIDHIHSQAIADNASAQAEDVGIVTSLKGVAKDEDIHQMSVDAFNDACRPGNPKDTSVEDIEALYRSLM